MGGLQVLFVLLQTVSVEMSLALSVAPYVAREWCPSLALITAILRHKSTSNSCLMQVPVEDLMVVWHVLFVLLKVVTVQKSLALDVAPYVAREWCPFLQLLEAVLI